MTKVPVQVVKKVFDALDFIVGARMDNTAATLGDIAAAIGTPNTTARNILKSMEICGYLSRGDGQTYLPGPKCVELSRKSLIGARLMEAALGPMHALAEETGESLVLATIVHAERKVLLRVEGSQVIRVGTSAADGRSLYEVVTSRALLAYLAPSELKLTIEKHGLPGPRWNGISSEGELEDELKKIRRDGIARDVNHGQVFALAVPIFDEDRNVLAALGIFMPAFRAEAARREELSERLKTTARKISARI